MIFPASPKCQAVPDNLMWGCDAHNHTVMVSSSNAFHWMCSHGPAARVHLKPMLDVELAWWTHTNKRAVNRRHSFPSVYPCTEVQPCSYHRQSLLSSSLDSVVTLFPPYLASLKPSKHLPNTRSCSLPSQQLQVLPAALSPSSPLLCLVSHWKALVHSYVPFYTSSIIQSEHLN